MPGSVRNRGNPMLRLRFALPVLAVAGLAAACALLGARPASVAIVGATVIHPEYDTQPPLPDSTVVITGDRIAAVGPAATTAVPTGATVIDGHGKWVIPGLIDGHVHFFQSGGLYTRPDIADFTRQRPYRQEMAWIR